MNAIAIMPVLTTIANAVAIVSASLLTLVLGYALWDTWSVMKRNLERKTNLLHKYAKENDELRAAIADSSATPHQQAHLRRLIKETKGKFFSVTFIKKDGEERTVNGKNKYFRLMSNSNEKNSSKKTSSKKSEYVPFVNRNRETWVSAHPSKVVRFKCGDIEETF